MNEFTGTLEDWTEDKAFRCVWGNVYNDVHERFLDGTHIYTSHIVELNREEGFVRTLNSVYQLGREKA